MVELIRKYYVDYQLKADKITYLINSGESKPFTAFIEFSNKTKEPRDKLKYSVQSKRVMYCSILVTDFLIDTSPN